ncbi:hypothetical protein IU443_07475 [Nocardia farcinica]|uniref:hypothetical protein n=1 Tax=Nocardia TaxID=1817 RepID=UPI000BF00B9A|nr:MULTISPECIES: hypothetical protein [Nocardia]MBA4857093.1 hypothetical protein [Nocardia farcinica]MBC9817170.1 hypothetical protein [Nocardia farcinica]MBF6138696.1 hypothetical protein [Nocardia farcinica]MBF6262714.1 hypothetical protein [Nocardia farcinica]MBF6281218.1 hypothetical protein [Nocardia farcinica]
MPHLLTEPTADLGIVFAPSHCRRCVRDGRPRHMAVVCEQALSWPGGTEPVRCEYACPDCGHRWTDTWPARFLLTE